MTQTTALKRSKPENPYKGIRLPDNVREQTKQNTNSLNDLMAEFDEFMETKIKISAKSHKFRKKIINKPFNFMISPSDIEVIIDNCRRYENYDEFEYKNALFVSRLIQNHYDQGNDELILNIEDNEFLMLGQMIEGTSKRPLKMTVNGNISEYFCDSAKNCILEVNGDVGFFCGENSNNCIFNIDGDVGNLAGYLADYSIFDIKGNAGDNLGANSNFSSFYLEKKIGFKMGINSYNSTFHINEGNEDNEENEKLHNAIISTNDKVTYIKIIERKRAENSLIILRDERGNQKYTHKT